MFSIINPFPCFTISQTGEHYGEAWGHFSIYGRVRAWDGLIVLLRVPVRVLARS